MISSSVNALPAVVSPYLSITRTDVRPAPVRNPAEVSDTVQISSAARASSMRPWSRLCLAMLMAAPVAACVMSAPDTKPVVPPSPPTFACSVAHPADVPHLIDADALDRLREPEFQMPDENATALAVAHAYGARVDALYENSDAFMKRMCPLATQRDALQAFAAREAGTYTVDGHTVTVVKNASGATVRARAGASVSTLTVSGDANVLSVQNGSAEETLRTSDAVLQWSGGDTTRSLYLKPTAGHFAGDFEVVVRKGTAGGTAPGTETRLLYNVSGGTSLVADERELRSGVAGNVQVETVTRDELSANATTPVRLRELVDRIQTDVATGRKSATQEGVEIMWDGSARVHKAGDGSTAPWVYEPPQ